MTDIDTRTYNKTYTVDLLKLEEAKEIASLIRHSKPAWKRDGFRVQHEKWGNCSLTYLMKQILDLLDESVKETQND